MPLPDSQLNHCKNQKGPAKLAGPFSALFSLPRLDRAQGNSYQESNPGGGRYGTGKEAVFLDRKKLPRVLADTGQ